MGRLSIKSLGVVESAITNLQSDADGADLAVDLLNKTLASGDVSRLITKFWQRDCVGIKSVRAAIYALQGQNRAKLRKCTNDSLAGYIFYVRELVSTTRHLDHLNASEWLILWSAAANVPYDSALYSSVCICWCKLLEARHLVPPDLEECIADVCAIPYEQKEQVYDGYLMCCLRHLQDLGCGQAIEQRALQLVQRPRIKNLLYCHELALIVTNLKDIDPEHREFVLNHLNPHTTINPEDIEFGEDVKARPNTDQLPWICCRAIAALPDLEHHAKRARSDPSPLEAQIACFSDSTESITPHYSLWYFIWVAKNVSIFNSTELVDLFTITITQYSHFPDSAPYALAKILTELTARDEYPGPIISQINAFMNNNSQHWPLNSATIYLFRVFNSLKILDQEFQRLLATKMHSWLAQFISNCLETQQVPIGIFTDLIGCEFAVDLTGINPSRGSYITFVGFCLYLNQPITVEPPQKLIKTDLLALFELHKALSPLEFPADLAHQLEQVVINAQVEPELIWRAQFLLTSNQPTIQQFAYAQLPAQITDEYFKRIVQGVFGTYAYNRDPKYIGQIIEMMAQMTPRSAAWTEFFSFLFGIVTDQSPFSPLRVSLARLVTSARHWRKLFETSSSTLFTDLFKVFKMPSTDFGDLFSAQVDPSVQGQYLVELAKAGGNMGSIVAKLMEIDFSLIQQIATHFKTTLDGLFRDVCPKVFLSWSLSHPIEDLPWSKFENSEQLRTSFPLLSLPRDWITDKSLFALYYVVGLQDQQVADELKSQYSDRQYELMVKRNFALIQYKCWSTLSITPRDSFWTGFPEPELGDVWLQNVPLDLTLNDQVACWIMEQLVLSVARFRKEDLYTVLRQLWMIYTSLEIPDLANAHLIRCCIALVELSEDLRPAFAHLFKGLVDQLEGPLVSEILSQFPEFVEHVDDQAQEEPLYTSIVELCRGRTLTAEMWVYSFNDLEDQEFPIYYAKFLCKHLEISGLHSFTEPQRRELAPILYRWTQVLNLKSPSWLSFVGKLVGEFPVEQAKPLKDSSQERLADAVEEFCAERGYLVRFSLASLLRRLDRPKPSSKSSITSIKDFSTKAMHSVDLAPTDLLLDPTAGIVELSTQLFDHLSSYSLYKAFRISPELAPILVPYQVAIACDSSAIAQDMRRVISTQLTNKNQDVQRLMLKIVAEAYTCGHLLADFEPLVKKCIDLGEGDLGLLLVELWWSGGTKPDLLPQVLDMVDDPDLKLAKAVVPSLETMNLSAWDRLGYSLSSFNEYTASGLRDVGAYQLANLIDKTSFYDYKSAWELQQWDLPGCEPTTRVEMLFNLFKNDLDFNQSYAQSWKMQSQQDIFAIETINEPKVCADDHDLRLAREYYFDRFDKDKLVKDLSLNCQAFCKSENKELALVYAQKLAKVATEMADPQAQLMSSIQSARVSWLLGDQITAINMVEQGIHANASRFMSKPSILTLLAQWSAEAHHVTDTVIYSQYLEPAVKEALLSKSVEVQASTFHTFAKFCDERFNNKQLGAELYEARSMRDEQKKQIELHKQAVRQDRENRMAHSKLRKSMQLYEIEQKEYQELKDRLRRYLDNSVKFYLKSLELCHSNTLHDAGRFITLWFSNSDSASLESIVKKYLARVPSHMFIPWINQLTSRLDDHKTGFQQQLIALVKKLAMDHPYHTLWPVVSIYESQNSGSASCSQVLKSSALKLEEFCRHMITVANHKVKSEDKNNFSISKIKGEKKWWNEINAKKLVSPIQNIAVDPGCKYTAVPTIQQIDQHVSIANGISAPKVVQYVTSDGLVYSMLLKGGNDDLRQDAVMEQVFGHVNEFLKADPEARKRKLRARTYQVVPLGPTAGVIEFVQDTKALISILTPLHEQVDDREWTVAKARDVMHRAFDYGKDARIEAFDQVCSHVHPCFRNFFFEEYRDPQIWLEKRTNYARSTALMSIIGYILGLGDRHCNNILLDVGSGEVVHIDLGIAFDQGKLLRIPETVPFRLTRDIVDAFGVCGTAGTFSRNAELALGLMRVEEDRIMAVLEVLRYDPLYSWSISSSKTKHAQPGSTVNFTPSSTDADQALLGVKRKLGEKLNAKATVRELIQQATSNRNLALIFEGWCPFY